MIRNSIIISILAAFILGCSSKGSIKSPQINPPLRSPKESVTFEACQPDRACLDLDNFKNLFKNIENDETYIKQLENLLQPFVKP